MDFTVYFTLQAGDPMMTHDWCIAEHPSDSLSTTDTPLFEQSASSRNQKS
jgi:hypothetical protein